MAYANGAIPLSALAPLPGGQYATPATVSAYDQMNAAFQAVFGKPLQVNSAYRTLAQQAALVAHPQGGVVAAVGTSEHGNGDAIDFGSGVGTKGSPESNWMYANAGKYGFAPTGASFTSNGKPAPEYWHWQFMGGGAGGTVNAASMSTVGASVAFSPYAWPSGNVPGLPFGIAIPKRFVYDGLIMILAANLAVVGIVLLMRQDVGKLMKDAVGAAKNLPVPVPV